MKKYAVLATLLLAAPVLAGCNAEVSTGSNSVSKASLEKQLASTFTPDDPEAKVSADCAGALAAKTDATQDCHMTVGDQEADVRVSVTKVADGDVNFKTTPFVPADTVAETLKQGLLDQGYTVDTVECEDELLGVLDETTTCTASPADGDGTLNVTVTSVDGLLVNFNYKTA